MDSEQTVFVDRCSNISRSASINDPLYGCQWHLNYDDQFRNGAGQDIRVEEAWPTYTGSGINVAVVDDGMHYQHEDLTDIYDPFEDHGTAVAGLIAAKDNSLGMRGVAPEAKIYGTTIWWKIPTLTKQTQCLATRQLLPYPTTAGVQETLVNLSLLLDFGKRLSRTASPPDMAGKAFSTPLLAAMEESSTTPLWTSLRTTMP